MGGAFKQQQSMVFTVFAAHSLIIAFLSAISGATAAERSLPHFSPSDVEKIVAGSCLVAANSEAGLGSMDALTALGRVFSGENGVVFGLVDTQNFIWTSGNQLSWTENSQSSSKAGIVLFRKQLFDRSCLFRPLSPKPKAEAYGGPLDQNHLVPFINKRCHTFRSVTGSLNIAGKHRQEILSNLFRVRDVSNINMKMALSSKNSLIFRESENYLTSKRAPSCVKPNHFSLADFTCGAPGHGAEHLYSSTPFKEMEARQSQTPRKTETGKAQNEPVTMKECEKISAPTQEEFFHKYLKLSKPVIIKGAVDKWPAMSKWTNRFLRDHLRGKDVHIKLTPNQEYEGVEKANIWEDHKTFKIPYEVRSKLLYPDLVVVRPATLNLPFEDFLDVVESVANGTRTNISAYLEYTSIPNYMPDLEVDLVEPDLMAGLLKRKHLNMWLSDGNTVGKLHFDQFDNLLCQVRISECHLMDILSLGIISSE